ncbi:Fe-S cluster assembly ATPase SufC [Candidatus Peregrinibacteria bacterium]|nr:Fe-S cluster assembly ATPase SufC [Candidatus Peregrinibacteria bacterium]
MFEIKDIHVAADKNEIVKGVSLTVKPGELHAIMGPNGSGKSSLSYAIMGHPHYKVTSGSTKINGNELLDLPVNERAHRGLFLGFQYPHEVPGITFGNFLRNCANSFEGNNFGVADFYSLIKEKLADLKLNEKFVGRALNDGFSGGEKKRSEIAQLAILKPKYAILDEIDSGLDVDALKLVADEIEKIRKTNKTGFIVITHYKRLLNYLSPDHVHVMAGGQILKSGDKNLAEEIETDGYEKFIK